MNHEEQTDIDMKLHAFGQRLRAAWDARQVEFEKNIAAFREGVCEDWQQEHTKAKAPEIEAPKIEGPKIEGPEIEGPKIGPARQLDAQEPER